MSVINTNINALTAQASIARTDQQMSVAMQELSTGLRINSAKDDAAGMAISTRMTAQINGLNQAVRNAQDGISMVQTADGAYTEVTNMLQRMRELSVQAANDTLSSTDRTNIQTEYNALSTQIDAIGTNTTWNGKKILNSDAGDFNIQTGAASSDTTNVTIHAFVDTVGTAVSGGDLSSATNAQSAIDTIDTAMDTINSERATLGASINSLQYTINSLTNTSTNMSASRSRIQDTDFSQATAELARTQIIKQASTAMLAQANQQPQSVLSLLKQ